MRELRDLTRTSLRQDHTAVANRMQKILEEAHVKIASVATDWLGVSGRKILQQMLDGEPDSKKLADVCRGRLREKIPERELALEGRRTSHHRWMLRLQREQLEFLERRSRNWTSAFRTMYAVTSRPSICASPLLESKGRRGQLDCGKSGYAGEIF